MFNLSSASAIKTWNLSPCLLYCILDISFIPVDVNESLLGDFATTLTGIPILVPANLLTVDLSFINGLATSVSRKFLWLLLISVSILST